MVIALIAMLSMEDLLATLTIRNLDDRLKSQLRVRAARHDRSMEEEARTILRDVLSDSGNDEGPGRIGTRIKQRLEEIGGVDLTIPARDQPPRSPERFT